MVMMIKQTNISLSDDAISLAFAHSKQLFIQEMEDINKYERMLFVEFLELIARISDLWLKEFNWPMVQKIEKVLSELFELLGDKVIQTGKDQDIDSESDYEDDLIELA